MKIDAKILAVLNNLGFIEDSTTRGKFNEFFISKDAIPEVKLELLKSSRKWKLSFKSPISTWFNVGYASELSETFQSDIIGLIAQIPSIWQQRVEALINNINRINKKLGLSTFSPAASSIVSVSCESCSCGSITDVVIELDDNGRFGYDFECDNCNSKTSVAIYPGTSGDIRKGDTRSNEEEWPQLTENVERKEGFSQVCVWPGTTLKKDQITEFEEFIKEEFATKIQFLEVIFTKPDSGDSESGGRSDIFFAVHQDDVGKFAVPRLAQGIRWIEDVLDPGNYTHPIYPDRVYKYKTW